MPVNFNIRGTQTGRLSSRISRLSPRISGSSIDEVFSENLKRAKRMTRGLVRGMKTGVCFDCPAALACVCGAVYAIEHCTDCRTTTVFLMAKTPVTAMEMVKLPAGKECQGATHLPAIHCMCSCLLGLDDELRSK